METLIREIERTLIAYAMHCVYMHTFYYKCVFYTMMIQYIKYIIDIIKLIIYMHE